MAKAPNPLSFIHELDQRFISLFNGTISLDPDKDCLNYPNQIYKSFKECDLKSVQQILFNKYDQIMPFWASPNFSSVTNLR